MPRPAPIQLGELERGWDAPKPKRPLTARQYAALKPWMGKMADRPRCQAKRGNHQCNALARKGRRFCSIHLDGNRRAHESNAFGRGESRYLSKLEKRGLLPLELLALPCWRRLATFPTSQRSPMRLQLLLAWDTRFTEPLHWAQTQRIALNLVANPGNGKTRHVAFWYENL